MSDAMFRRIVDEALAEGLPLNEAIALAADHEAHYEDSYDRMRREAREALDSTGPRQ